jgi:chromosome segregation ATPase
MEHDPAAPSKAYGTTRARRASVSYGEVERAATALLKSGKRPTIEGVREALGGGAPDTITSALTRYWKDLGDRIEGDPASLSRLPAEVADIAERLWRRALSLAADAAAQREGADRTQLEFFKRENELRAHTLSLKETELDALLRSRERTIQELETHLRTAMGFVQQKDETLRAMEARTAALEGELEDYRRRLLSLIQRTTTLDSRIAKHKRRPVKRGRLKAKSQPRRASKTRALKPRRRSGSRRARR